VGVLVLLGVFAFKDNAFLLREILSKTSQGQRTQGTPSLPSAEVGKTSQQGDVSFSATSESPKSPALNEENLEVGDTERASFNIEAIVWASDARNSFVVINGAELRVGDSIEGKTITRIEEIVLCCNRKRANPSSD